MSNFYCAVGRFLVVAAGLLLCAALVALLMELCCERYSLLQKHYCPHCGAKMNGGEKHGN